MTSDNSGVKTIHPNDAYWDLQYDINTTVDWNTTQDKDNSLSIQQYLRNLQRNLIVPITDYALLKKIPILVSHYHLYSVACSLHADHFHRPLCCQRKISGFEASSRASPHLRAKNTWQTVQSTL